MADNQPTLFDSEIWKPVVGYEGLYEVSNQGRVRGLDRVLPHGHRWKGKVLKPKPKNTGHVYVILYREGTPATRMIHRLVLESFVGVRPKGTEACHNNGIANDNRLENLRWDTPSANELDKVKHGTHKESSKTHCRRGHLLKEPNLRASVAKRGGRGCLACCRAHSHVRYHAHLKSKFQEVADKYYESIMSSAIPVQSA